MIWTLKSNWIARIGQNVRERKLFLLSLNPWMKRIIGLARREEGTSSGKVGKRHGETCIIRRLYLYETIAVKEIKMIKGVE